MLTESMNPISGVFETGGAESYFCGFWIEVQNAQRLASIGITLKHSEHFLVVGSTGFCLLVKATNLFIGNTTKKYITEALMRNDIKQFKKSPIMNLLLLTEKW